MRFDKNSIKRILVITLSNLGDIILTTPVVEVLLREFPQANIDVMIGPNGKDVFQRHPRISELIIYDKFKPLAERLKLFMALRRKKYSVIVDLRNTLIPYLIGAPYKTLPFKKISKHIVHKKDVHLWKLKTLGININNPSYQLYVDNKDREYIDEKLKNLPSGKLVVINAGAKSPLKRWTKEGFIYIISRLKKETGANIVMIGSPEEKDISSSILKKVEDGVLNLAGETTVRQLIALLQRTDLLITNDSAPMHMASILGTKQLAIFGPTDSKEYGPFNRESAALQKPIICQPCKEPHCALNLDCMKLLKKEKVFEVAKALLDRKEIKGYITEPKRILLVRTDRIGDVALSTPAIKAVWDNFSSSYIAFMVRPYAEDIVCGNPYLDEVIVFDKKVHKGVFGTFGFAAMLRRRKKFDMAIILHPTNRVHIITFLAGIPQRIGYDKKMGFLLTKRILHTKQFGKKHEMEYTLDVLRNIGIEPKDRKLFIPVDEKAQKRIKELLLSNGVNENDILIGIHPGASCPSKRWTPEKFAELADKIIENLNTKVAIITGPQDIGLGNKVASSVRQKIVNLSGALSIKDLTAVLKRCSLFISNDSGPVHIAVAVGTPVISIFGRNEQGLSPTRWKPLGEDDVVIHKDVGCKVCLAHDCKINFECLKSISVDEVLNAVYKFKDRLKT